MEVVVFGALTGIWWISSVTVLLPFLFLLKYSKYFQDKWFAVIFTKCCKPFFEARLFPLRKRAFEHLGKSLAERDNSSPLKILEIGIGTGANLQFYPENSHLTALDINANFEEYFRTNQQKYPHIVYERTVTSSAEDMKEIDDCSMDVVISTYVLCSVVHINDVLSEVMRVLKPGGRFLFLEHVGYPKSDWGSTIQNVANPLWKIYFDGCCLTRNTAACIKEAGFKDITYESVNPKSLILFIRPQLYGVARKDST